MLWELSKQRDEAERVVQVSQGINERGVSVLDDWRQRVLRSLLKVLLRELDFPSAEQFLVFLKMGLNISELVEQLVVLEYFEVFNVIIGLIIALELLSGLSWVDSLED